MVAEEEVRDHVGPDGKKDPDLPEKSDKKHEIQKRFLLGAMDCEEPHWVEGKC